MSTSESIERETNRSGTGEQNTGTHHGAPPVKVLVVDDHPVVRLGLTGYLSGEPGITVIGEAASCQEACTMAASLKPDVVLLDLQLGDATHCDAVLRIKECQPQSAIIVITGEESRDLVAKALSIGVCGYLHKGASREMICQAVRAACCGACFLDKAAVRQSLVNDERARERGSVPFNKREEVVLQLMAAGKGTREMSGILHISERRARFHVRRLLSRLGSRSRPEALRKTGLKSFPRQSGSADQTWGTADRKH